VKGPFFALEGLTLSGGACGPGLSRQKREFGESGCSLLESATGPHPHIENVTRGTVSQYASSSLSRKHQFLVLRPISRSAQRRMDDCFLIDMFFI